MGSLPVFYKYFWILCPMFTSLWKATLSLAFMYLRIYNEMIATASVQYCFSENKVLHNTPVRLKTTLWRRDKAEIVKHSWWAPWMSDALELDVQNPNALLHSLHCHGPLTFQYSTLRVLQLQLFKMQFSNLDTTVPGQCTGLNNIIINLIKKNNGNSPFSSSLLLLPK